MRTQEVIEFFGNPTKAAAALGITTPAVLKWGDFPPELRQYQIEKVTKGKLKAEPATR